MRKPYTNDREENGIERIYRVQCAQTTGLDFEATSRVSFRSDESIVIVPSKARPTYHNGDEVWLRWACLSGGEPSSDAFGEVLQEVWDAWMSGRRPSMPVP